MQAYTHTHTHTHTLFKVNRIQALLEKGIVFRSPSRTEIMDWLRYTGLALSLLNIPHETV